MTDLGCFLCGSKEEILMVNFYSKDDTKKIGKRIICWNCAQSVSNEDQVKKFLEKREPYDEYDPEDLGDE